MDEFTAKWVQPFYLNGLNGLLKCDVSEVRTALAEVDTAIVDRLLSEDGWREQLVGSWFCGLKGWTQFEDQIGTLLMASEFIYAGQGYCFALACFLTDRSRLYLVEYLDHYLRQPEKFYDQHTAMSALMWIDEKRGSQDAAQFLVPGGLWETFKAGQNDAWDLEKYKWYFWTKMEFCLQNFGAPR